MLTQNPLFILAALACFGVVIVLTIGIGAFGKGGEFNRKHANRLMRYRIIGQAIAVILIVLFAYFYKNGGQ